MTPREQDAHEDLCRRLVTALNERDAARAEVARALIDLLADEQARRCAYGTRDGDGRTCDCKYANPLRPWDSEATGCPELRAAVRVLRAALGGTP